MLNSQKWTVVHNSLSDIVHVIVTIKSITIFV